MDAWDGSRMDALLMLAPREATLGYDGCGDFHMNDDGRLTRREVTDTAPYVFTGVSIARSRLFDGAPDGPFSLVRLWDRAIAAGRVYGMEHRGLWMHVGTPQSVTEAEAAIRQSQARAS
jgi:MurNAc alpha-1-phosphate uridylyltransferase